ncbi:MAG: hypothetical protein IID61_13995 [SAR324 cluster bacterium]|nr:hypothetical protein [SAR324 cluster bacterium]
MRRTRGIGCEQASRVERCCAILDVSTGEGDMKVTNDPEVDVPRIL